ncbi:Nucleotide-binding alpha-beta plait domain containing protein [Trema orientale]|uniref:Nucleotide-binding alpha-beta plait domain containing protein n=1 Tax=Trema orientale TaxID=63057 RepID=A0A2P5D9D4_TREOI|nr:Nucleotide-binding alpha-beta plait domain containing protein [Trema orientale]
MEIGELVWAKVGEESSGMCWWPGLIQAREEDTHGVVFLVSFFDHQNPRHFQLPQLRPFSDGFLESMSTDDLGDGLCGALLDSALRLLCRRAALSLRCRCRSEMAGSWLGDLESVGDAEAFEAKRLFRPEAVLGFVQSKAVLPWVEVEGFIGAVKGVAQIQVFRDYNAIGQRVAYRKASRGRRSHERATRKELRSYLCSKLVADESSNLEPDNGGQVFPKRDETNMEAGLASRMKPLILLSNESFLALEDQHEKKSIQVKQGEEQSLYVMTANLRCLALESSRLVVNWLNITEQNIMRFRNFLSDKVSDTCIKKCFPLESREAYYSRTGYFKTQQSVKADGIKCDIEVSGSIVPDMERPVRKLGCKRRLDLNAVSGSPVSKFRFKRRIDGTAYSDSSFMFSEKIDRTETEVASSTAFFKGPSSYFFDPFVSFNGVDSHEERNSTGWKETSIHNSFPGSLKLEIQNIRAKISTNVCNRSLFGFLHSISDSSLCKDLAHLRNIVEISKGQEVKMTDTCMPYGSVGIRKDNRNCYTYSYTATEEIGTGFQNEDMKVENSFTTLQSSATEFIFSEMFKTNASDVGILKNNLRTVVQPSEFSLNPDKIQMQPVGSKGVTSFKSDGKVSSSVAFEDGIENTEILDKPCASDLLLNLHDAQQSKALARFAGSTSLHMKFPRDSNLPSKKELVKKFSPFGPVDSLKTKIFYYTGSAQVVFCNQSDAMVAYQYAKRKKLLSGYSNVWYWLDPFENKRGGTKPLNGKPFGPKLKSCIRNSSALGTEDKRKAQKVRFLMET